ncbi:MAG TPA: MFS transporter [Bacteroidales bacterium]
MKEKLFSKYQVFVIALLAVLQFTVVMDFIVLSPLGAQLMRVLHLTTSQFGLAVSVYAFSAGISGLLAAGFADKFDRKKLLLFFYTGFIVGTFLCGIAPNYQFLLMARVITGSFGGVISSISFAIITDLFKMEVRGRVLGFVQMAFATSQVMGIPVGLYFANKVGWHAPFLMITGLSIAEYIAVVLYLKPIDEHLKIQSDRNAFSHLFKTVARRNYLWVFLVNTLLITGGFMLMPFGSAFSVNNLGINIEQLPLLYFVTGVFAMAAGPFIGKFSDSLGKYKMFVLGSILTSLVILFYCNLGITPLWIVIALNVGLMVGVLTRIISSSALITEIPDMADRGAFMSVNSSIQQIAGGIASIIAGLIVVQTPSGALVHYNTLGYIVVVAIVLTAFFMYSIDQSVQRKIKAIAETKAEFVPKEIPVANIKPEEKEQEVMDVEEV